MNLNPGKTEFTSDEHAALRNEVERVKGLEGLSEAEIGRQADLSSSTLNSYLKSKYGGDNNSPASSLHKWLEARRKVAEMRLQAPEKPNFLELQDSRQILSTLSYAREMGRMVVIAGAPGVSKTSSCLYYAHLTPRVWMATMEPATRGVPTMLTEVLAAMGEPDARGTPQALARRIAVRAAEAKSLIIIDEAQHLSDQAIEQLRSLNDRVRGLGVAIVGNEAAYSKVGTAGGKTAFAQVSSRMARRHTITAPQAADVQALAHAWASVNREELDAPSIRFLQQIAAKPGGLRNVEMTIEAALFAARGAGAPVDLDLLRGAFAQLAGLPQSA